MSQYYVLDGHTPKPVSDVLDWAEQLGSVNRRVDETMIGDVRVSTVFLGLDHSFFSGPPLLFETMIFGGAHDQWEERCSTWDEAVAMHARAVEMVQKT